VAIAAAPAFNACSGAIHIVRDPKSGTLRRAGLLGPKVAAIPPTPKPQPKPEPGPSRSPPLSRRTPEALPGVWVRVPERNSIDQFRPHGCPTCSCENNRGTSVP